MSFPSAVKSNTLADGLDQLVVVGGQQHIAFHGLQHLAPLPQLIEVPAPLQGEVLEMGLPQGGTRRTGQFDELADHLFPQPAHFEETHEGEQEALPVFGVMPGQYAVSDVLYDMNEKNSFEYTISWSPMGQYIRIGLLSEDKKDLYFVSCISGKDEGIIDLIQIPAGKYFVAVYNETSDHLDVDELKGNITYCFR